MRCEFNMKKIKLPLEMSNGVLVRTLDELKENWDLEKVINYYLNGKLLTWLNDRYYTELAEAVSALNDINDNVEFQKKLCNIFGIEAEDDLVDMEAVAERNRRLKILRQYTADDAVLKNVDKVAFNQEELADLLDEDESVIYLCDNKFSVPLSVTGKKYIGLGDVEIQVNSKDFVDFTKLGIELVNVHFNKEYEELVNSNVVLYKKGEELEAAEKYTEALEMYKKAGAMGNSDGLFKAGKFYHEGRNGVEKNYTKAVELYKKAALLKNVWAMDNLGDMYRCGNGVEQDYLKAKQWYEKAADLGSADAMGSLGNLYLNGQGVAKNDEEALKWFRKGAEKGEAWIIGNVGHMYHYGLGVKQDYVEALKWYQKAAEGGNAFSMNRIGDLYYFGNGVNQDYTEAMKWYRKAADLGNDEAAYQLGYYYNNISYKEAVKWYELAIDLDKSNSKAGQDAADMAAAIYEFKLGDVIKAFNCHKKIFDKFANSHAYYRLMDIYNFATAENKEKIRRQFGDISTLKLKK